MTNYNKIPGFGPEGGTMFNCRCINIHTAIALSTNTEDSIKHRKSLCLQAAARCRQNGRYEMCAMWLSKYKQLVAKYEKKSESR